MQYTGASLNVITMFGLIMVLGIVVDDAIIVVENVKRHIQKGLKPKDAAIIGTKEVAWPVIATILTNIASLFPILLAQGTLGIFLSIIPQVAIFALVFSLVEALAILPSHCADFVKITKETSFISKLFNSFRRKYLSVLINALRYRYFVIGMSSTLLALSFFILFQIPFVLLYVSDVNQYLIKIQNPTNYSLELTDKKSSEIEKIVSDNTSKNLLKNSLTTLGIDFSKKPPVFGDHVSNILIQFQDFEERKENGLDSMKKVQAIVEEKIIGPESISFVQTAGPPKGKDLDIRIIGNEIEVLTQISKKIKKFLKSKDGVYGVTDDLSYGKTKLSINVDEQKAALYGLSTLDLGKEIRAIVDGLTIDETRVNDEKAYIKIKITNSFNKNSSLNLSEHLVRTQNGSYVPISNFTNTSTDSSLVSISRYNRERAASITAEIDSDITTPRQTIKSVIKYFNEIKKSLDKLKITKMPKIICEPGRALVAESGSTIVKVNLRKKQKLYINDGTYGTLFDAGTPNIVFPSKMIKENTNKIISKKLTAFDFFGPTCDSMDYMKGPFLLPNNIKENDYIELGQLGAYGLTFRTQFNGYYSDEIYEVEDQPILTMYDKDSNKATLVA